VPADEFGATVVLLKEKFHYFGLVKPKMKPPQHE
jgi:hypothetical protein